MHGWTYDFMQDATADGRMLRVLTVVDEFTRVGHAVHVARRMPASQVIDVLEALFAEHGSREWLPSDNGAEFVAKAVTTWHSAHQVKTHRIDPRSPSQNPFGESFSASARDECLNMEEFYGPHRGSRGRRELATRIQQVPAAQNPWLPHAG